MSRKNKRPILNDQQFSLQMQAVSEIYDNMQIELFDTMIRRLKIRGNADLEANPYIWQLEKLNDMYMLNEENFKIIIERTGIAEDLLREVIENEGLKVYKNTREQLLEDLNSRDSSVHRYGKRIDNLVKKSLEAYVTQAVSDLNLINTTLPKSIQSVYKSVVEQTVAQVVSGAKTSNKALDDTVMLWQERNFTGFIDRGGRRWRADVYARTIIKSTTYKVFNEMRTRPAEELGIDTFYYSMKSSARESCSHVQHQIVTKEGQTRIEDGIKIYSLLDYGYGTAAGCLGIHCGHYLTPFVVGINEKPDLPDYLKDITPEKAEENAQIEAKQRAIERRIRKHKERLHYAKILKNDEMIEKERLSVRKYRNQIRQLINDNDFLNRDYQREKIYS